MQVNSEIELTLGNGKRETAICRDLSGAGMQIFSTHALSAGSELNTSMSSGTSQVPPLKTRSAVVRCEPRGDGYVLGVRILSVLH